MDSGRGIYYQLFAGSKSCSDLYTNCFEWYYLFLVCTVNPHPTLFGFQWKPVCQKHLQSRSVLFPYEHYTDKIPLDDWAEHFFINKFYLSKIFKETYGTTVNNYLISKRITRAKQLLRFTDMTVDEVGAAVGMGDANYFSRMFRKVEGISPREYRKQW